MIDELKRNIETEIEILKEMSRYNNVIDYVPQQEIKMIGDTLASLRESLKIINSSIPSLLKKSFGSQTLPSTNTYKEATKEAANKESMKGASRGLEVIEGLERVRFRRDVDDSELVATLNRRDRERFLKELSISESLITKLKKHGLVEEEKKVIKQFTGARGYLKIANKFLLERATKLTRKGLFKPLSIELKKGNLDILFETYVAMMLFTTYLSIFLSIILMATLLFLDFNLTMPFVTVYSGSILNRILQVFWIPIVIPLTVFFSIYFYPSTEKSTISKKIDQELPFAVIHMSAISGSGIPPSEIFKIIGMGKEYPALSKEFRKILNQINIYGYDLVTALTNSSKSSPSPKLSELFSGVATTISSGGELSDFFEKRADTLLMDYRLEREKFTKIAETFMDIYISIVIAAPMILMLLLIMMFITGFSLNLTPTIMTLLIVSVISLLNLVFLGFLHLKQPGY